MFIWKCKITHLKLFDCLHKSYYFRKETIPSFDKTTLIPLLWLNKTHSKEGLLKCVAVKTWKSYFLKTSVQTTPVLKKESKMEENWQIKFMKKRLDWNRLYRIHLTEISVLSFMFLSKRRLFYITLHNDIELQISKSKSWCQKFLSQLWQQCW